MQTAPVGAEEPTRPLLPAARAAWILGAVAAFLLVLAANAGALAAATDTPDSESLEPTLGQASWYGQEFASRRTASGEIFDPEKLTGAHRTLPLGTRVRVTNLHNGRSVLITIIDRGPFRRKRAIDLSYGAARALGMLRRGIADVLIEPL